MRVCARETRTRVHPRWSTVRDQRQALECVHDSAPVGYVSLGLGSLASDPSFIHVDMISVRDDPAFRGGLVSNWLIDRIVERWPEALLQAGLSARPTTLDRSSDCVVGTGESSSMTPRANARMLDLASRQACAAMIV